MIKVPATAAGIPAITELIGAGVNVNVTLIFGLENYKTVADAYLAGLEKLLRSGPSVKGGHPVNRVASVASFFVSRVDSAVDKALEEKNTKELQGKIAIANSKVAYAEFKKIFSGPRWEELEKKGARVQRVLWASTSAKNPEYPDTLYVDELIGPQTANTLPPATVDSFIDHGKAAETLTLGVDEAQRQIEKLKPLGIDLKAITQKLQDDGVIAFARPFDALMQSLAEKKGRLAQRGA
jgi:transaldolase